MTFISYRLLVRIIAPVRIHMHTDEIHPPSCCKYLVNHALIMGQTALHIIIVPGPVIKERTVCLAETMQVDDIALRILQIASDDIKLQRSIVLRSRSRILLIIRIGNLHFRFLCLVKIIIREAAGQTGHHQHSCGQHSIKPFHDIKNYLFLTAMHSISISQPGRHTGAQTKTFGCSGKRSSYIFFTSA